MLYFTADTLSFMGRLIDIIYILHYIIMDTMLEFVYNKKCDYSKYSEQLHWPMVITPILIKSLMY